MESSGRAESKTVPGFEFRATFEADIVGFTLMQVLVATTVYHNKVLEHPVVVRGVQIGNTMSEYLYQGAGVGPYIS